MTFLTSCQPQRVSKPSAKLSSRDMSSLGMLLFLFGLIFLLLMVVLLQAYCAAPKRKRE